MDECIVCYNGFDIKEDNESIFSCSHRTCADCAKRWTISCPMCRCISKRSSRVVKPDLPRHIELIMEEICRVLLTKYNLDVLHKYYSARDNVCFGHRLSIYVNTTDNLDNLHRALSSIFTERTPYSITITHFEKLISVHF